MHFLASKRSSDLINSVLWNMEVLKTCMFWHRREAPIFRKFKLWDSKQAWLWKIQVSEDWEYGLGLLFFWGIWTPFTSCTILAVKILIFPYSIQSYVATVGIYCFNLLFPYRWLFFDVLFRPKKSYLMLPPFSSQLPYTLRWWVGSGTRWMMADMGLLYMEYHIL